MRGGARPGAGRKTGWRKKDSQQRPQCQMRAWPEEWELVKAFAKHVKHGNRKACEEFLARMEATTK